MGDTAELLPCPFCGGVEIRFDLHTAAGRGMHHEGADVWSMCCYTCGATFPNRYERGLLVAAWNRRAHLAAGQAAGEGKSNAAPQEKVEVASPLTTSTDSRSSRLMSESENGSNPGHPVPAGAAPGNAALPDAREAAAGICNKLTNSGWDVRATAEYREGWVDAADLCESRIRALPASGEAWVPVRLFELMDIADEALDKDTYDEIRHWVGDGNIDAPDDGEIGITILTRRKINAVFLEIERIRKLLPAPPASKEG